MLSGSDLDPIEDLTEKSEDDQSTTSWWRTEDWLAVWLGLSILIGAFLCGWSTIEAGADHPWKPLVGKPSSWESNPLAIPCIRWRSWRMLIRAVHAFHARLRNRTRLAGTARARQFLFAFPVIFVLADVRVRAGRPGHGQALQLWNMRCGRWWLDW